METIQFKTIQTYPKDAIVNLEGVLKEPDQVQEWEDFCIADVLCRKFLVHKGSSFAFCIPSREGGRLETISERVIRRGWIDWYRQAIDNVQSMIPRFRINDKVMHKGDSYTVMSISFRSFGYTWQYGLRRNKLRMKPDDILIYIDQSEIKPIEK